MTHSHRRKNSRFEYFRMDVPRDLRELAGKTSWQHTLSTSDPTQAAMERSRWTSHYKAEVIRLRAEIAQGGKADAASLIRRAFTRLTSLCEGSLDAAVAFQLRGLGEIVRSAWSVEQHRSVAAHHGVIPYDQPGEQSSYEERLALDATLAFDDPEQQRLFVVRAELFERQGMLEGIVYQELATALIARRQFGAIRNEIDYLPCLVPDIRAAIRRSYDQVAEAYLSFLAKHHFKSWPTDVRQALAPVAVPPPEVPSPPMLVPSVPRADTDAPD